MFIESTLLAPWLIVISGLAAVAVLAWAALAAPWQALEADHSRVHAAGGSLLLLVLLHSMAFGMTDGLVLHLLGISTVTLLLGLRFTLLLGAVAVLISLVITGHSVASAPLGWWLSVAAPAMATRWWVDWLRHRRARHPFIYIMGAGFFGGILAALVTAVLGLAVLAAIGQTEWVGAALANWPVIVLIAFPEGFINGTLVTAFVVLAPDTLKHFDSDYYFLES
jgi:uncharacterized membrane protein